MAEDEMREDPIPTEETNSDPTPKPESTMPKVQGSAIPWRVMEIIEAMPDEAKPIGFIHAQVNTIVITENGFYGHYDGQVQRLPMTLVDIP